MKKTTFFFNLSTGGGHNICVNPGENFVARNVFGKTLSQEAPQPGPVYLPVILKSPSPSLAEWTQHAHDAQRTGYTAQVVETPWRWKWAWNGPNATGGISSGKFRLPRNSQPITGGDQVYIAAGSRGVYALNNDNGGVVWNRNPGGNINSTPAYDAQTGALFVLSSNGVLYKLEATTGNPIAEFATGASSDLPLPPAWLMTGYLFRWAKSFCYQQKQHDPNLGL
ncbi:MAG: PQQ-binding-like beta-propeller repeat protein [Anaerolineales bacterium]|nr:PQQ-binding-like beta-propeller repeat protein [Anaerolineales bacterium]